MAAAVALAVGAHPGPAEAAGAVPGPTQRVEYFPGPGAEPRQVTVPADTPARTARRTPAPAGATATARALQRTGPVAGRLDLVVMGDGYTADEQGEFASDAEEKLDEIFDIEPYRSYRGLFNIWLVGAVSRDSGVSGDPTADVTKDTTLGAHFFCDGLERLLCVDTDKVADYAALAPDADIVFVIANSAKYGGAGYGAGDLPAGSPFHGVATMSSANDRSYLIGAHELGHSIGHLADEYQYAGYGAYPYTDEPAEANLTLRRDPGASKWYRWLGADDPTGSVVGTYEGGGYYETGVYRPTETSIMRSLASTEFNVVGREAMIAGFYADADALTSSVPTSRPLGQGRRITVRLAPLTGLADLELTWYVDGRQVRSATGDLSVTPHELGVHGRGHEVTATVTDRTTAVRDPAVRAQTTDSLTWTVR
ncbi:M64 family metallopeptidase [Streptomyces sp. NPDC008240]|uniref:M64 family metallopeptidase n=1 Tax=Streptomyces sp. NPDC008240 TaxID=3364822 RepID=UPI0036E4AC68